MDILFSILIASLAAVGLLIESGIPWGKPWKNMLLYYTSLSNLLVLVYRLLYLIPASPLRSGPVQAAVTLSIWLTHLVYTFILLPGYARGGLKFPNRRDIFSNIIVHFVVPLLSLAAWVLTAPKDIPFSVTFWWLLIPLAYFVFVLLRARTGVPITKSGSLYPYPFMDREKLGNRIFALYISLVALGCWLLGAALYIISLFMR